LPVSECSEAHSRGGQFCSDLESGETYKSEVLKKTRKGRNPRTKTLGDLDWAVSHPLRSKNKENLNALRQCRQRKLR